jgi:hypothetical protein
MIKTLPTHFAPAERAMHSQIEQDAALFSGNSLTRSLLDAIPDTILVLNHERQVVFANEACVSQLKLADREAALGQRPGELVGCAHATEGEGGCGTTEFCRNCGAVKAILSSINGAPAIRECQITLRNGDALDLRACAKPLDVEGQPFTVFTLSDMAAEKRRRALERIFFHDVLNTAGLVSMVSEIIHDRPAEAGHLIDNLYRASHRLIDEISSQRDLASAESGELIPAPERFNAFRLMAELAEQYACHPAAADRSIDVIEPGEWLTIESDRTLLGRVLGNMIKNALEASQPGDTVTLSCTDAGSDIRFAVHNPTYMPNQVQLQVFNRSFSTKGIGRGLGTYSMKLLSERYLGGRVCFETSRVIGTTFYADYPMTWHAPIPTTLHSES